MAKASVASSFAERLQFSGLDKKQVKQLAGVVAKLRDSGLQVDDVFPNGIIAPDSVLVKGQLGAEQIDLIRELLVGNPRIGGITIFPRGIPAIDRFRVNVTVR